MNTDSLSVREIEKRDIGSIVDYWFSAEDDFLIGMGVDLSKMPNPDEFADMLLEQLSQNYEEKQSYCIIWEADGKAIGHSNVGKIEFGEQAFMHLHMWTGEVRKKGMGTDLVKMTIPYFFKNLKLKRLCCEPYALNPAPNKTLGKVGFTFVKEYITTPGWINFEQPVKRWEMSLDDFKKMK